MQGSLPSRDTAMELGAFGVFPNPAVAEKGPEGWFLHETPPEALKWIPVLCWKKRWGRGRLLSPWEAQLWERIDGSRRLDDLLSAFSLQERKQVVRQLRRWLGGRQVFLAGFFEEEP